MTENHDFMPDMAATGESLVQSKNYLSRLCAAYAFGGIFMAIIQFYVPWLIALYLPNAAANMDGMLIISSLSLYLLAMPLLIGLVRRVPGKALPQHRMSIGKWFVAFLMSYAIMYISNLIGIFTTQIIGVFKGDVVNNPLGDIVMEISPVTAFVLMVVCAPVVEEYVFRKLLIDRTVKYGEKTAIVLSGFMFGLFHGNLNQFVYAFTLGILFGFIYVKTGRIIYTITLHAAINFMGSIPGILMMNSEAFTALEKMSGEPEELIQLFVDYAPQVMGYLAYVVFILILVIVGGICWAVNFRKMKCVPGEIVIQKGKWFRTVFLNAGMILYILYWGLQIVRQLLE